MATATYPTRVLYVDDEPAARRAFARVMSARGFDVQLASSGLAALRKAQQTYFPVVVTDLRMPGMDGLALIEQLQGIQQRTAFIVLTGVPEVDLRRDHRMDAVISSIVSKPWDDDELAGIIRRAAEIGAGRERRNSVTTPDAKPLSVLVVEDNNGDADLVRAYLEFGSPYQYRFDRVARLDQAVDRLRETRTDLVISDLSLPDAAGVDCVERLCKVAPETALIVLSGLDDEEIALHAVQLGAQDYLVKGRIDRATLHRSIRYAMERKRTERRLAYLAHFDQLTGLANRVTFHDRLTHALARASRNPQGFGVMVLDLDGFKMVNDSLGHDVGDALLLAAGDRLREAVRDYDTVARLGGDEFAVLAEDSESLFCLEAVAERILTSMRRPFEVEGHVINVSASVGIASYPESAGTLRDLMKSADAAMYDAKRAGRDRFSVFTDANREAGVSRLLLEQGVRRAVAENEFHLDYQPQVDVATQRVVGLEALMRWRPAEANHVPPSKFIPVLEETGLIGEMGAWAIRSACRQLREWMDDGMDELRVAVNLSARQFDRDGLLKTIEKSLEEFSLPADSLEFEITESTLMQDLSRTSDVLNKLKEMGVRIAIDDFGTGYSSLAYLHRFQVDVLKIDRSFVQSIGADDEGAAIASAIIGLGRRLGLQVIAEGVETEQQLTFLAGQGCDVAQGYYFARPAATWDFNRLQRAERRSDPALLAPASAQM